MKFRYLDKNRINNLPKTVGVYALSAQGEFLYIGKAVNIKNRVKNHFNQPNYKDEILLSRIKRVGYIKTNSEVEALILESELIKKYKPKYNTLWKDDKNYFYVAITKQGYVYLTHQPLEKLYIGPFVDGKVIKKVLKILRKPFPYYSQKKHSKRLCSWCHLNLCPGPEPNSKKHKKNINNLKAVLKGKSQKVLKSLKKEMKKASKEHDFERAAELRDKIMFLEKVLENARVFEDLTYSNFKNVPKRIEAYDVSNIHGKLATGSMVVFIDGRPKKDLYRKFRIKWHPPAGGPNDTAMIKEILKRRLKHKEWPLPDLFLIDGGKPQLSAAKQVIKKIPVAALAKKNNELFIDKKPVLLKNLPRNFSNLILQLRDEAHRFAITYHKKLREIDLGLKP